MKEYTRRQKKLSYVALVNPWLQFFIKRNLPALFEHSQYLSLNYFLLFVFSLCEN